MKSKERYWGSVRFYKHLILTVAALVILVPNIGFWAVSVWNWRLKQDYRAYIDEQMAYIGQLEEQLASYNVESSENRATEIYPEEKESLHVHEAQDEGNIADRDMPAIPFSVDLEDWKYRLVNDSHPLSESYQPELVDIVSGRQVHKGIAEALEQMIEDAEKEVGKLIVCSAYRDYEKQAELVENSMEKLMQEGYSYMEAHWKTRKQIALVGISEHHTGLAVDLVGEAYQSLDERQADTLAARWLEEHAHEYGFILRYPRGKEDITGIFFESWHYRYVGEEAAAYIREHQLCLEEFLELAEQQEKEKEEN